MNFIKYRWISFIVSGLFLIAAIVSLILFGLKPAIDFTGGSLLEVTLSKAVDSEKLYQTLSKESVALSQVQQTSQGSYIVRFMGGEENKKLILDKIAKDYDEVKMVRFESVGPTFGRELLRKAIAALILTVFGILAYVTWRFGNLEFGVFAVLAMIHDNLILLGSFALLGHFFGVSVDVLFITAALTTLSASVHDTVITFDYVRKQSHHFSHQKNIEAVANKALNDTVVRNVNNSWTIIFMLTAVLLMGGETVKWFAAALLIGSILGTYSSTFLAVPLLVTWENIRRRREK